MGIGVSGIFQTLRRGNLEQHQHRAAAAIFRSGLAESKHIISLREPASNPGLQNRFVIPGTEPLAVYHTHTAEAAFLAGVKKSDQLESGFVARVSMQVKLRLNRPVAAS